MNYNGQRINYSPERIAGDEFWLQPFPLLFENGIREQRIDCFELNGQKAFFKTAGDIPFDIFAASFYLLSRYEEYLPHRKDMYGRYAHENSLAFKENFLDKPLVNYWLHYFKSQLTKKYGFFPAHHSAFSFLPTYDIDEAYCYKYKAWWRSAGAAVLNILKGEWDKFSQRRKVLDNKEQDPFDSYDWIDNLHRPYKLRPRYFFLVPAKTGKYDRNNLPAETAMQDLLKKHSIKYSVGVHPSWQSGDDPSLLKIEIETIERITTIRTISSRQHFIRFTLPETFRLLLAAGIREDFSMGYGSINGFRASVASAFYWYDLEKEEITYLVLYPFCYMDANSFYEKKATPSQALAEMHQYYQEVKKVNGLLITIWHNTFLGTHEKFKGWRDVYRQFFNEISREIVTSRKD